MAKIKALFFDLDLTLVDTRASARATYLMFSKIIHKKPTKRGFQKYVGSKFSDIINFYHKESNIPKSKLTDLFIKKYSSNYSKMTYYGRQLFKRLNKSKAQKIIILSNNNKQAVKNICKHFNIRYDKLIANEDMKKSEKKHNAILKTIKKLKIKKSEAIYIGDHINDVIEAHKAGVKSAVVPTGMFNKIYIKKYHPDFMISSLNRVIDLIE